LALAAPNEVGIALGALTAVTPGPAANTTVIEPLGAWESDSASLETNPTTLSGTYAAQSRSVNASLKFPVRIDDSRLTSTATDGCAMEATLQPRPKGNVYTSRRSLHPAAPSPLERSRGRSFKRT